jgi:hypothetical protein
VVGLLSVAKHPSAAEYLLEVTVDENQNIKQVLDGNGNELAVGPFEKIEGFNLRSMKSMLFSEISYKNQALSCCWHNGRWYSGSCLLSKLLLDQAGEVLRQYVFKDGKWIQVEDTETTEHEAAVISQSKQKSYILAIAEKNSELYGMIIAADGMIYYNAKEFAPQ